MAKKLTEKDRREYYQAVISDLDNLEALRQLKNLETVIADFLQATDDRAEADLDYEIIARYREAAEAREKQERETQAEYKTDKEALEELIGATIPERYIGRNELNLLMLREAEWDDYGVQTANNY